jgi:hypothetical protein
MKGRQRMRVGIGRNLAIVLPLLMVAMSPMKAGAVTLGSALGFSALSTAGDLNINNVAKVGTNNLGSVGGNNVTLGNNSKAGGNATADPGNILVGNFSKVMGTCFTNGGTITTTIGAKCVSGEVTTGDGGIKAGAITDAATFETALVGAAATATMGPVTVLNFPSTTITAAAGLNIIDIVGDLTLNNSSTLFLSGNPGDQIVLRISGDLHVGSGAKIVATGINPQDVLIYVAGSVASWGNSTKLDATILAPLSACSVGSSAKIDGAIICRDDVTFLQNATLLYDPSGINIPSPAPFPLTLGDAKGFLIVSTGGDTKLGNVTLGNPASPNAGDIGGNTDTIGNNSTIQGDVVASSGLIPDISLGNFASVVGTCFTNGGTVDLGLGASCGTTVTGSDPKVTALLGSGADAANFSAVAASFTADQTLPAINIPASGTQTITCSGAPIIAGVTVVSTPSIKMGGSSTLKIDCAAGQIVVINVTTGAVNLGAGFNISLVSGITPDSVVFNVEGIALAPPVLGGSSSHFNGTLVAPAQTCKVSTGAAITGQLVCAGDVTAGANLTATYAQLVPIP